MKKILILISCLLYLNCSNTSDAVDPASITYANYHSKELDDWSFLSEMINLDTLILINTNISDLSPICSLTNLRVLDLGGTTQDDFSCLSNLKSLIDLGLQYTNISDLSPICSLSNLAILRVNGTNVTDLYPLTNLKKLRKLEIGRLKIRSIHFEDFMFLESIGGEQNPIESLTVINSPNLVTIPKWLDSLKFVHFENLPNLVLNTKFSSDRIDNLTLVGTPYFDTLFLPHLTNLKLNNLPNLKLLSLNTLINSDISGIENLIHLKVENESNIESLDFSKLTNLKYLDLNSNLDSLYVLKNCTKLEFLVALDIKDIAGIESLINLELLALHWSSIESIAPLLAINNLRSLTLTSCDNISDYELLYQILQPGDILNIFGSNISQDIIDSLNSIGVDVQE